MNNDSFRYWMRSIASAAMKHCCDPDGLYYGPEGCKRLARECGVAIPDFSLDEREQNDMISRAYSAICVVAYNLKPPIDAKDWFENMRQGRDEAMDVRRQYEVCEKTNPY